MNECKFVKKHLTVFIQGDCSPKDEARIQRHLLNCTPCANAAKQLMALTDDLRRIVNNANAYRQDSYWLMFAERVERKLESRSLPQRHNGFLIKEIIDALSVPSWRYVAALSFAVFLLVVVVMVWRKPAPLQDYDSQQLLQRDSTIEIAANTSNYFRKSKALLIGLQNMKSVEQQSSDLSVERKISRQLLQEARVLKQQPLTVHSVQLIDDMNKVLLEVANSEHHEPGYDLALAREGIQKQNLLFKIRMAENFYDQSSGIFQNVVDGRK